MSKKTITFDFEEVERLIAKAEEAERLMDSVELAITAVRDVVAAIRGTDYLQSFASMKKKAYYAYLASYQIQGDLRRALKKEADHE